MLSSIGASRNRTINDTVTFAAPIVIGEPFELGIYSLATAASGSNSSFPTLLSTADVQTGIVTWGGSADLTVGGVPVANFSVSFAAGNACDPDIAPQPNDCIVNVSDLGALKAAFFSTPPAPNWNADADFDSNGVVNAVDLGTMKAFFFDGRGPSGVGGTCP